MANLTSEDVRKLIEASSWKHPYTGHGNDFVLPLVNDLGVRWTAFVRLIDAEGDKVQRLVILSSTDSVPEELRQRAYEFCNKWMAECSYVQTWFSEEQGKVYVSASVESPGDLPKKWLVDSFVGQSLEIIVKFWTESFVALGGLDRFKASQKAKAEATPESGAEPPENVREAAEQGDAESQFKMGEMYRKGVGVELDYAKAAMWFRKAAEQGHADAIFHCKLLDGIFGPQAERPAGNMSAKEEPCGHGNGDGPEGHSPVGKKKIGVGLGLLVVALVLLVGMFVLWYLCF